MNDLRALRLALRLNAGFSTLSAVVLCFASARLGEVMGVPPVLLIAVGIGLAVFAVQLVFSAARSDVGKLRSEALRHSMADLAWVVGTVVVVALGPLTRTGNLLLVAVGVPVLVLGLAQLRGLPPKAALTT